MCMCVCACVYVYVHVCLTHPYTHTPIHPYTNTDVDNILTQQTANADRELARKAIAPVGGVYV
jgi:hypothetical protein